MGDVPKEIALLHAFMEGFKLSFETQDEYWKANERLEKEAKEKEASNEQQNKI
jgi:hypothetical protein